MHLYAVGELLVNSSPVWRFLEPGNWPAGFGDLAFVLLVFAPGAWITFGLPLKNIAFSLRVCLAIVLSPTIVCAEFYALRLIGVPFPITAVLLVVLNLPAAYLIWRRRGTLREVGRGDWLIVAITVLVPLGCMASVLSNIEARIYSGASWLHADAVYMLVRGDLVPEASTLAGVRMSYPVWSGLVFEAIHSYLTQSPAQVTYVWSNLFLLIAVCGFAAGIARELGGGRLAQASSAIFLLLGTNPVGYLLTHFFPLHKIPQIWGDERFTPWVNKFMLFGPMTMGIAMTMAIIYLLVRPGSLRAEVLFVLGLLLCSIGLFYPLLFPSACGVLCARALADVTEEHGWKFKAHAREALTLAGLVLLACVLTYTEVRFMTAARHNSTGEVLFSTPLSAARKLFAAAVSTSLLLVGVALSFRRLLKVHRRATILLVAGAAASCLLNAVFFIPFYENEYKFIFTAAMCLAVFPAIAFEQVWQLWPRAKALPAVLLVGLLIFGAYGHWAYWNWPAPWLGQHATTKSYPQTYNPPLNFNGSTLQLNEHDPQYGICNAVKRLTPALSVLLVDNSTIYYPGLTNRSLYVSAENRSYPGVNLWADALDVEVGGYGPQILAERRGIIAAFFGTGEASIRESALNSIQQLNRPIAVIVDVSHPDLLSWLKMNMAAHELFEENGQSLWLIEQANASQ